MGDGGTGCAGISAEEIREKIVGYSPIKLVSAGVEDEGRECVCAKSRQWGEGLDRLPYSYSMIGEIERNADERNQHKKLNIALFPPSRILLLETRWAGTETKLDPVQLAKGLACQSWD